WVRLYEAERSEGEEFNAFAERVGAGRFEETAKELTLQAELSLETMQQFIDWNRSSPYKVERGEGECAISTPSPSPPRPTPRRLPHALRSAARPRRSSGCSRPSARATTLPARFRRR